MIILFNQSSSQKIWRIKEAFVSQLISQMRDGTLCEVLWNLILHKLQNLTQMQVVRVSPDVSPLFCFCFAQQPNISGVRVLLTSIHREQHTSTGTGSPPDDPSRCQDSDEVCVHHRVCVFMRGLWLDLCLLQPLTLVYPHILLAHEWFPCTPLMVTACASWRS